MMCLVPVRRPRTRLARRHRRPLGQARSHQCDPCCLAAGLAMAGSGFKGSTVHLAEALGSRGLRVPPRPGSFHPAHIRPRETPAASNAASNDGDRIHSGANIERVSGPAPDAATSSTQPRTTAARVSRPPPAATRDAPSRPQDRTSSLPLDTSQRDRTTPICDRSGRAGRCAVRLRLPIAMNRTLDSELCSPRACSCAAAPRD
jgi:hypothetical protein